MPPTSSGFKTAARIGLWCGFLTCMGTFACLLPNITTEPTAGNELTIITTLVGGLTFGAIAGFVSFLGTFAYFKFGERNHPGIEQRLASNPRQNLKPPSSIITDLGASKGRKSLQWRTFLKYAAIIFGICIALVLAAGIQVGRMFSNEARALAPIGKVSALRSALDSYRSARGDYPSSLRQLVPDYIGSIPPIELEGHNLTSETIEYGDEVCVAGEISAKRVPDFGHYGYVSDKGSPCFGKVFLACTHVNAHVGVPYAEK